MDLLSEELHGEVSLARPSTPDGVTECKNAIELRVEERCLRSPFVKWLKRKTSDLSFGVGPNRRRLSILKEVRLQGFSGDSGRHAAHHGTPLWWVNVPEAMRQKFHQPWPVDPFLSVSDVQQSSVDTAAQRPWKRPRARWRDSLPRFLEGSLGSS